MISHFDDRRLVPQPADLCKNGSDACLQGVDRGAMLLHVVGCLGELYACLQLGDARCLG